MKKERKMELKTEYEPKLELKLTKELLQDDPKALAKKIIEGCNGGTSATQIRRFYNDFLILKAKSDTNSKTEEDFTNCILPLIYFSKAKIAYAQGKENGKISDVFAEAINKLIDQIKTREDFNIFIMFYQALIGYVTYADSKNGKNGTKKDNKPSNDFKKDFNGNKQGNRQGNRNKNYGQYDKYKKWN